MQKRLVRISSAAIMIGIFTALVQTSLLYFIEQFWIILVVAGFLDLLFCQYLLENSFSFAYCFRYLFVTELLTLAVGVPAWFGIYGSVLPWSPIMIWLFILHLALPLLYCTVRYLMDFGPRFMKYNTFFAECSILLWIALIGGFLYCYVYQSPSLTLSEKINLIPGYSIATQIEAYIQQGHSLRPMFLYMLTYGGFFVPSGFYLHLMLGKGRFLPRILAFLLLPILIEVAQYFLKPSMCEIDDLFPALLGCIVGSILYTLVNHLCLSMHEERFLQKRSRTSFYL